MKKYLLLLFALSTGLVYAKDFTGRVNMQSGVLIFAECTPIAKYEVLGEINFSYTPTVTDYNINSFGRNIHLTEVSSPRYQEMRDGLIAQSVLANRSVTAILLTKNHATMIKFEDGEQNTNLAVPGRDKGICYYIDSEPVANYDYVTTVHVKGLVSDYTYTSMIANIQKQLTKKKYSKLTYNAIIYHFGAQEGSTYAELVNIK